MDGRAEGMFVDKCHKSRQENIFLLFFFLNMTPRKTANEATKRTKGLFEQYKTPTQIKLLFLFVSFHKPHSLKTKQTTN